MQCFWPWDDPRLSCAGLPARVEISVLPSATSRLFYELLGEMRFGFLVVSLLGIACKFLRRLGAETEAHPGYYVVPDQLSSLRQSSIAHTDATVAAVAWQMLGM
jgi:hypothetical protein